MQTVQLAACGESVNADTGLAHLASSDVLARARKIKLFLMDVDGTLTDGSVCLISVTIGAPLDQDFPRFPCNSPGSPRKPRYPAS